MAAREIHILVSEECAGLRIDQAIAHLSDISRTRARKCLAAGSVYLNGKRHHIASTGVRGGDRIEVHTGFEGSLRRAAEIEIIHRDKQLVAVNKPAGIPAAPTRQAEAGSLPAILKGQLWLKRAPEPIHRLDLQTSGAMLLAFNHKTALKVAQKFSAREVTKCYLGVVDRPPEQKSGIIEADIGRHPSDPKLRSVESGGKPAVTHYRVLGVSDGRTILLIRPVTGRTHQIRLHLRHIGSPVVGDPAYGMAELHGGGHMMLHCLYLGLEHPAGGRRLEIFAQLPEHFADFRGFVPDREKLQEFVP